MDLFTHRPQSDTKVHPFSTLPPIVAWAARWGLPDSHIDRFWKLIYNSTVALEMGRKCVVTMAFDFVEWDSETES